MGDKIRWVLLIYLIIIYTVIIGTTLFLPDNRVPLYIRVIIIGATTTLWHYIFKYYFPGRTSKKHGKSKRPVEWAKIIRMCKRDSEQYEREPDRRKSERRKVSSRRIPSVYWHTKWNENYSILPHSKPHLTCNIPVYPDVWISPWFQ